MGTSNGEVSKVPLTKTEKNRITREKRKAAKKLRLEQRLEAGETGPPPKHPFGVLDSFYCSTCRLKLDSQAAFDAHLGGMKHKKKLKAPIRCDVCDVTLADEKILEMHEAGAKHQKRTKKLGDPPVLCKICCITSTNEEAHQRHLEGAKHKKRANLMPCRACGLTFSKEEDLAKHEAGPKHMKKLKYLELIEFLDGRDSGFIKDEGSGSYFCIVCDKAFEPANISSIPIHIVSTKHVNNLRGKGEDNLMGQPPMKKVKA